EALLAQVLLEVDDLRASVGEDDLDELDLYATALDLEEESRAALRGIEGQLGPVLGVSEAIAVLPDELLGRRARNDEGMPDHRREMGRRGDPPRRARRPHHDRGKRAMDRPAATDDDLAARRGGSSVRCGRRLRRLVG